MIESYKVIYREFLSVERYANEAGECLWTGRTMTSGRCLIPPVLTNSTFLIGRRCPLPNRFRGERYFLSDQTFLLSSICLQHNPTLRNGSTLVKASSSHARTSFTAFLTAFSSQSSRNMRHFTKRAHVVGLKAVRRPTLSTRVTFL